MTTLTPQRIADLKASIAKRYQVAETPLGWCVVGPEGYALREDDWDDPLDAEAEMEVIIQDDVKAAMEEME